MPPGTLRTVSIQTKEYINNSNDEEPKYRGNSVLPPDVVTRPAADSFSQSRIRDDSFAEPPGIEKDALMEDPPGVLVSSSAPPDEGFVIRRPRMSSQDSVRSADMESIPRMSVTSLPSPGVPEQMSSMSHSSFSSMSASVTKKEQKPRRETYTSPSSVPPSSTAADKEEKKTISSSSSLALDISLRVSSSTNEDDIIKQTRIHIANRLGVPLSRVTIVGTPFIFFFFQL